MRKDKIFLFFLTLFLSFNSGLILYAQDNSKVVDSLKLALKQSKGEQRITILHKLTGELVYFDTKSALMYAEMALKMADSLGIKKLQLTVNNDLGIIYIERSEYAKARAYYLQSLHYAEALKDSLKIGRICGNIGNTFNGEDQPDKALGYFMKALKIFERLKKTNDVAMCYAVIGNLYMKITEYNKALNFYNQALDLFKQLQDENNYALTTMNIGVVYKKTQEYEKSIINLKQAIPIFHKNGYLVGEGQCYANLGNIFFQKGDFKQSVFYLKKAMEFFRAGDNKNEIVIVLYDLGTIQDTLKMYDEALKSLHEAIKICEELDSSPGLSEMVYKMISQVYANMNDYKQAYTYALKHVAMHDSAYNQNAADRLQKLNAEFEAERRENKIQLLTKDVEKRMEQQAKQRVIIYSCIGGIFLVLIIVLILLNRYKIKQRANKELELRNQAILQQKEEILTQKDEITSQRDEIEAQRDKLSEQNALLEEQKQEITDSIKYAKRIQNAVLSTGEYSQNILGEHFILFKPKDIVSGDFYWATKINDLLIVTVADCTGHGVPGAFMSMLGVSFLNEIVRKKEILVPSEVLNLLRESIIEALQQKGATEDQKDGMDIALCVINIKTLEMQFAGANNPCWIVSQFGNETMSQFGNENEKKLTSDGQFSNFQINQFPYLIELKPDKQPIGIHTNMQPFTNQKYQLQKGDIIYLMSDGFEDQFGGPNRKKFLAKNLKDLLTANSQDPSRTCFGKPMAEQKHILETAITEWIGTGEQIDDITIMGIRI